MISLIADSGATKTNWVCVDSNRVIKEIQTRGLNPNSTSKEQIKNTIQTEVITQVDSLSINEIHFYGAGLASEMNQKLLHNILSPSFQEANIHISTDLIAAGKVLFQHQSGIACILGTGSNAGLFRDGKLTHSLPSLGYLIGDFGSGFDIGKRFLRAYQLGKLPDRIKIELDKRFNLAKSDFISDLYASTHPNATIANIASMVSQFQNEEILQQIVYASFSDFVDLIIDFFPETEDLPIGFVGSIAHIHRQILQNMLSDRGLNLGLVLRDPISGLIEYHTK